MGVGVGPTTHPCKKNTVTETSTEETTTQPDLGEEGPEKLQKTLCYGTKSIKQ